MEGFEPTPTEDTATSTQRLRPRDHLFLYAVNYWSYHIYDSSLCLVYMHIYSRLHLRCNSFCHIICQKPQPRQPQEIIENTTNLKIVDSNSPGWVVGLTFQTTRPKVAMPGTVCLKMARFWPTWPSLAIFWSTWLKKKWLRLCFMGANYVWSTRPNLAIFWPTWLQKKWLRLC